MGDRVAWLRATELFGAADAVTCDRLATASTERVQDLGSIVFLEGDRGDDVFVVRDGLVLLWRTSREGDRAAFGTVTTGGTFGELSVVDGGERSASAEAVQPTRLVVVPGEAIRDALRADPDFAMAMLRHLATRLRLTTRQHADRIFLDLAGRVARYLLGQAERVGGPMIDVDLRQSDVAALVGASRQSVNETIRLLERDGVIARRGTRLELVRLDVLRAQAGEAG